MCILTCKGHVIISVTLRGGSKLYEGGTYYLDRMYPRGYILYNIIWTGGTYYIYNLGRGGGYQIEGVRFIWDTGKSVIVSRSPCLSQVSMATNGGAHKFNKNENNWLYKHFEPQQIDVELCVFYIDRLLAFLLTPDHHFAQAALYHYATYMSGTFLAPTQW